MLLNWPTFVLQRRINVPLASVELEIEINAWDPSSTEVVVRPRARHPYRWGGRRLRRYFEVAHLTADALAQFFGLSAGPPAPVRRLTPLARSAMN